MPAPALLAQPVDLPAHPFPQQYSALGLPLTAVAWREQDAVDGGALRRAFSQVFGRPTAALLAGLRDPLTHPAQAQVLARWHEALDRDPQGALILELLPTEMSLGEAARALLDTAQDLQSGEGINDFRVSEELTLIRFYHRHLAATLRAQGLHPRALVLPYSNTPENVVATWGRASDGAERLLAVLDRLRPGLPTAAIGYSQGAAAVREAVQRGAERLDQAVLLAPMGGAQGGGEHGVWAGAAGRTQVLAIVNHDDPARQVLALSAKGLLLGALNFLDPQKRLLGGKPGFHGGFYGDPDHPLDGVQVLGVPTEGLHPARQARQVRTAAREAGIFAYPSSYTTAVMHAFVAGAFTGPLQRRGDWDFDLREELVLNGLGGQALDPTRTRHDPAALLRRWGVG